MNNFKFIIQQLRKSIQNGNLPGNEVQQKLAPRNRSGTTLDYLQRHPDFKTGSVMILLYPVNDQAQTVLIERTDFGNHAGQISFPGGKKELEETNIQTAIRETFEEIGVSVQEKDVLCELTEIYISPSNFLVYPCVAALERKPDFIINKSEVKRIIEIPLLSFNEKEVIRERLFLNSAGHELIAPYYDLSGVQIWGATAMILSEFTSMLQ